MKPLIATAMRQPRSFTMMKKLATHGTNKVIVTSATTACTGVSCPCWNNA